MGAVTIALFIALLVWLAERRDSILRPQPCWKCGQRIVWRGLPTGWVHEASGRTWDPCTFKEWDGSEPTPHPAARAWNPNEGV
jgi:hypothetical protein